MFLKVFVPISFLHNFLYNKSKGKQPMKKIISITLSMLLLFVTDSFAEISALANIFPYEEDLLTVQNIVNEEIANQNNPQLKDFIQQRVC